MSDSITKGTVTVDHNGVGTVALKTASNVVLLSPRELDDAIEALCAMRFEQDPAGYLDFIDKLIPRTALVGQSLTFKDIARAIHSGTVSAEGRTTVSVVDDES